MSAQGTPYTTGWGYWPSSDVYVLEPVWSEWHTAQSITVDPADEEAIVQNIVLDWGFDWTTTIVLTDTGTDPDSEDDDTPATGYVRTDSSISRPWGWSVIYRFTATPVLDDDDNWTGSVEVTVPASIHSQLGVGVPWSYSVTVVLDGGTTAPSFPVKVMAGYLVVRS